MSPNSENRVSDEQYLELLSALRPPDLPRPLWPAYVAFETLLLTAMFEGDEDRASSVARMITELQDDGIRATARYFSVEPLFYSAMKVVLAKGPSNWADPAIGRSIWACATAKNSLLVHKLGHLLTKGVLDVAQLKGGAHFLQRMRAALVRPEFGRAKDGLRRRARGAPPDAILTAVVEMILVQRTLPSAPATMSKLVNSISKQLTGLVVANQQSARRRPMWTQASLRQAITRHPARKTLSRSYRQTLVAERLDPIVRATFQTNQLVDWIRQIAIQRSLRAAAVKPLPRRDTPRGVAGLMSQKRSPSKPSRACCWCGSR